MVSLATVRASNTALKANQSGLVGVFVGATSGIGYYALREFAKTTTKPRAYFVGRSQEAGQRIEKECRELNGAGEFTFLQADTSVLKNVDEVCVRIREREQVLNILFLSTGNLTMFTKTEEGLHAAFALMQYSRNRFATNLLPLLSAGPLDNTPRRIVSVLAAGHEGTISTHDMQAWKVPLRQARGHSAACVTASLAGLAAREEKEKQRGGRVSFVHWFPGAVKSNLARPGQGVVIDVLRNVFAVTQALGLGKNQRVSEAECGERAIYVATGSRWPAKGDNSSSQSESKSEPKAKTTTPQTDATAADDAGIATGIDSKPGSGVYSVDWDGGETGARVQALMAQYAKDGTMETVWRDTEEQFVRIRGGVEVEV